MWLKSLNNENLKRFSNHRVNVGQVTFECSTDAKTLTKVIEDAAAKYKITPSQILISHDRVEIDEYGHMEDRLFLYYYREETDEEYNDRILSYKREDFKEILDLIVHYRNACLDKERIKSVIDDVLESKWRMADYQKEAYDKFMTEQSITELEDAAYKRGLEHGKKALEEFKKKVKNL